MRDFGGVSYAEKRLGRRAPTTTCQKTSHAAQALGQRQARCNTVCNLPSGKPGQAAVEKRARRRHQKAAVKHAAFAQHLIEKEMIPTAGIETRIVERGEKL